MPQSAQAIAAHFCESLGRAVPCERPYRHLVADEILPPDLVTRLMGLPFTPPDLEGVSGRRELHNASRTYCNAQTMPVFPALRILAEALQRAEVAAAVHAASGAPLDDTFLRLEYAVDADGFWLEPHTDLGIKKFTCLIYLADDATQGDLGTDLYDEGGWCGRVPFTRNTALIFVPAADTLHGFERRPIGTPRRSLILNYVGRAWRDRAQLAFPDRPLRLGAKA